MAGQNVRDSAPVVFDEVSVARPVVPPHGCVEIKHVPDQAVVHGLDAKLHGRVIPVHVPDLDRQIPGFRLVQQLFELGQRFAARFVQMDVLSGSDTAQRGRNANPLLGFNRHGLQAGMVVAVAKSLFQGGGADGSPAEVLRRVDAGLQAMHERHASMAMVS